MFEKVEIKFSSKIWLYTGKGSWHFITLTPDANKEIIYYCGNRKRAWGAIKVEAQIGKTKWSTSIFRDSKTNAYILPLKKEVREAENCKVDEAVNVTLLISV